VLKLGYRSRTYVSPNDSFNSLIQPYPLKLRYHVSIEREGPPVTLTLNKVRVNSSLEAGYVQPQMFEVIFIIATNCFHRKTQILRIGVAQGLADEHTIVRRSFLLTLQQLYIYSGR
jgi:hypothetical protein